MDDDTKEIRKYLILIIIISILVFGGLITALLGIILWKTTIILCGCIGVLLGLFISVKFIGEDTMETIEYEPFDVVIYKPTGDRGLVKRVTEDGVFVLFKIQSTAQLCKPEDLEKE